MENEVVLIITFLLRDEQDLVMADNCFKSLADTEGVCVVLFNQGYMTNAQLGAYLTRYRINFHILGSGRNEGIALARQTCIEYVWQNLPECKYIAELHVDMIFPPDWQQPLTGYLDAHDEPLICPGIITQYGEIHPLRKNVKSLEVPPEPEAIIALCRRLQEDKVVEGFVSPVVFNNEALKKIGGYDPRFLKGM